MTEQIQKITKQILDFQGVAEQYSSSERKRVDQYSETLLAANIVCADRFSVVVAVNRENWGNTKLSIPWQVEILHDKFHQVRGFERCTGAFFSFNG